MATPIVVTVAPTGARKTKNDHPKLPVTPVELAECALAVREAGAAIMHLHVRKSDGSHSLEPDDYRTAIKAIQKLVGDSLILQLTTESGSVYEAERQMHVIRHLQPEATSLAVRELIPDAAHEVRAESFLSWMEKAKVMPQFILYDNVDVARYLDLRARGVIGDFPHWVLFVLGRYTAGQRSEPADLLPFLDAWQQRPDLVAGVPWAVCAFGAREVECAMAAALLGGHARVGFENSLQLVDGTLAPDNAALVRQFVEAAALLGYRSMSADQVREQFASGLIVSRG